MPESSSNLHIVSRLDATVASVLDLSQSELEEVGEVSEDIYRLYGTSYSICTSSHMILPLFDCSWSKDVMQ